MAAAACAPAGSRPGGHRQARDGLGDAAGLWRAVMARAAKDALELSTTDDSRTVREYWRRSALAWRRSPDAELVATWAGLELYDFDLALDHARRALERGTRPHVVARLLEQAFERL